MTSGVHIVTAARSWLGTRFHHQGRLKKSSGHRGGVDCLGLLIGVAKELQLTTPDGQLIASLDRTDYPHYPDVGQLRRQLDRALNPIDEVAPGDLMLFCIDEHPQHLGIVGNNQTEITIIHAYAPARAVVEHSLDRWWRQRMVCGYRIPGIIQT